MKSPHFYKAYSRLGIRNIPFKGSQLNYGVEDAPDAILSKHFLNRFQKRVVSSFTFPKPEDIQNDFESTLAKNLNDFKNLINQSLKDNQVQIVIGGDHSVSFSSFAAVLERIGDRAKVGYIQFDSHGDSNTYSSSPTKNFHGMFLKAFIEEFDLKGIDKLVPHKFPASNILFIGNLELDPEEKKFFREKSIKNITRNRIINNTEIMKQELASFIKKFEHIHISFDIDVFDQNLVTATGVPSQNGLMLEDVYPLIEQICSYKNWSFDLTELNPKKAEAKKAIEISQNLLLKALKNS